MGRKIRSDISKLINSIWNKEKLPEEWKESIIVPIYKKGDKADCSNYKGISLLSATYISLSNILLSRSTPYIHSFSILSDDRSKSSSKTIPPNSAI